MSFWARFGTREVVKVLFGARKVLGKEKQNTKVAFVFFLTYC